MRGNEYGELAAFVAVVEELSFRRAAARLGLTPSALSHTIRALEERLGVRLLNRTTRSVAATEAGRALFSRVAPAFTDIAGAVDGVSAFRDGPAGSVRINLPKLAADLVFGSVFGSFSRTYPDIRVELIVDDGLADIVAGGFDAGIRPGELLEKDMVALRVTPDLRSAVVGSPAYFATRTLPRTPRDLSDHQCIGYRWTRSAGFYRWPFRKRGQALEVEPVGSVAVNDVDVMIGAALDGAGLALTLENHVAEHIRAGRLVRVLEDWCQPFPGFFLYYPSRRQMPVALRTLVDFLRARAKNR
ncbi:MAG TPA: LysR family transcriptional regulator [Polyangiaceae bacterium]|nr:LysR family transcriptional regulator [Polyangiaceae bacterium]